MDEKFLIEAGRNKGLSNREHIEKDYFQDMFLYHLMRKTNMLVFKGGTALYKLYKMPRFSEDLDFTMLEAFDAEKAVTDVAKLIKGDTKLRKTADSVLFKIGFRGILTRYNTLRIDISLKNKVLEGFDVKSYVPGYVDINPFSLRVLKPEEMIAEKIHSILARGKARDLFDLFFLLRFSRFDRELTSKKLAIFGMAFSPDEFEEKINRIERLWEPELKPFVFSELPDFRTAREFVIDNIR